MLKMKTQSSVRSIIFLFRARFGSFWEDNGKLVFQFIFTLSFLVVGIWFIQQQQEELVDVKGVLSASRPEWIVLGILLMFVYILLQGLMYVFSFSATNNRISVFEGTVLFVKRNLISIFLPAGGVSSLAFFTNTIENGEIESSQIHLASLIYGFVGILSVVIVALPAFVYAIVQDLVGPGEWQALGSVILVLISLFVLYRFLRKNSTFYTFLVKWIPVSEDFITRLRHSEINKKQFFFTVCISLVIEFVGIAHLFLAMVALNLNPSVTAAVMGYIISVVFLIISPFLRGLGVIEVSMTYLLIRFGYNHVEAIAITLLYRFFEFWLPLFVGAVTFLSKVAKLLMRIFPAFLLSVLGIINIISVLTPAISWRVVLLKSFLSDEIIQASNYLVLGTGLLFLITAAFLLKGFRVAWHFALFLCMVSIVGNMAKAFDFEESTLAVLEIIALVFTRKDYFIKSNPKRRNLGLQTVLCTAAGTLIYGVVGFYFLDKRHFNIDFSVWQSLRYTIQNYFFIGTNELVPLSPIAGKFLLSMRISGFFSVSFLIYSVVRAYVPHQNVTDDELRLAEDLLVKFGNSSLDYFKIADDKMLFFSENKKAFISYRTSGNFAVVLENPVAASDLEMKKCISEFDSYCYRSGMKSIFFRVPEESLEIYHELGKKNLFLGQEGVVNLLKFKLEGGARKPMRNAINKVISRGYKATVHEPPIPDGVLQKIKSASNEWLYEMNRREIIFSQGMFNWEELKSQCIITVESTEGKVIAFLNIIPDFVEGEATYDLIRKTNDAPNGVMDFILVELFKYLKNKGFTQVNLGFAPMSGLDDPRTFPEKSMKFAYEQIGSFANYRGLREYKQKFDPEWHNKYLIYQNDYDLFAIPSVLAKVIKS